MMLGSNDRPPGRGRWSATIDVTPRAGVRSLGAPHGIIVRRRLPDQPLALRGWLEVATNATLEPGSAAVTWTSDTVSR